MSVHSNDEPDQGEWWPLQPPAEFFEEHDRLAGVHELPEVLAEWSAARNLIPPELPRKLTEADLVRLAEWHHEGRQLGLAVGETFDLAAKQLAATILFANGGAA